MADLVITAASVIAGTNAGKETGTTGATITAGEPVYQDTTTGQYLLADANSATAEARRARGIALNAASAGQPLTIHKSGDLTMGATLVAGVAYYLSGTAGGICAVADLTTGDYPCLLGMAKSTTVLTVEIQFPNAVL